MVGMLTVSRRGASMSLRLATTELPRLRAEPRFLHSQRLGSAQFIADA